MTGSEYTSIYPKNNFICLKHPINYPFFYSLLTLLIVNLFSSSALCFTENQFDFSKKILLHCNAKVLYFAYPDRAAFDKDIPSVTKDYYTEKFDFIILPNNIATKQHHLDMVSDEEYNFTRNGDILKLKSLEKSEHINDVINVSTGEYSSVIEKSDAMVRLKSEGKCDRN